MPAGGFFMRSMRSYPRSGTVITSYFSGDRRFFRLRDFAPKSVADIAMIVGMNRTKALADMTNEELAADEREQQRRQFTRTAKDAARAINANADLVVRNQADTDGIDFGDDFAADSLSEARKVASKSVRKTVVNLVTDFDERHPAREGSPAQKSNTNE
jgi:hypothetical protein